MIGKAAASNEFKNTYEPDLFTRQEISEFPWIFKNKTESAFILAVNGNRNGTYIKGFVESESRDNMYHYVAVFVSLGRKVEGGGFCECESRHYYGKPCKHVLSLRNMYVKHKDELDKLASIYPDIRRST